MEIFGTILLVLAFVGLLVWRIRKSNKSRPVGGSGGGAAPIDPIRKDIE